MIIIWFDLLGIAWWFCLWVIRFSALNECDWRQTNDWYLPLARRSVLYPSAFAPLSDSDAHKLPFYTQYSYPIRKRTPVPMFSWTNVVDSPMSVWPLHCVLYRSAILTDILLHFILLLSSFAVCVVFARNINWITDYSVSIVPFRKNTCLMSK